MTHILAGIKSFKLKCLKHSFVSYSHADFTRHYWWTGVLWVTCGLLWCFYQLLDSHSDGTHSLWRIHWWTSDVMLHFLKFCSDEEINILHLHFRSPEGEYIFRNFHFWVKYSFNTLSCSLLGMIHQCMFLQQKMMCDLIAHQNVKPCIWNNFSFCF